MIDKNIFVTFNPVTSELTVFFTQNESVQNLEFEKKTVRSRKIKRLMLTLLNIENIQNIDESHFFGPLIWIFRKMTEFSQFESRKTESIFINFVYIVRDYVNRQCLYIDFNLCECWYKPDETVEWWNVLTWIFND